VRRFIVNDNTSKRYKSFKIQNPKSKTSLLYALFLTLTLPLSSATLSLKLSPENPYVGEPVFAVLTLYDEKPLGAVRIDDPESGDTLSVERLDAGRELESPDDRIRRRFYRILPLVSGKIRLPDISTAVQRFDPGKNELDWRAISFDPPTLRVRPLPPGIPLAGDLTMNLGTEKKTPRANEPLHLELNISGTGNLELLPDMKYRIPGVSVYAGDPLVTREFNATAYRERWSRSYVIVSDRSFTLPALKLRYLNRNTGLVETLATPERTVRVVRPYSPRQWLIPLGTLLLGVFLGAGALLLHRHRRAASRVDPLVRRIRNARDDRELYRILLPYSADPHLSGTIRQLEKNLYEGARLPIDRRKTAEYFSKMEIRQTPEKALSDLR
jgi:hypothetical protein